MGGKELGFREYEQTTTKKRTKRENFSAEMNAVVQYQALVAGPGSAECSTVLMIHPAGCRRTLRAVAVRSAHWCSHPRRAIELVEVQRLAPAGFRA